MSTSMGSDQGFVVVSVPVGCWVFPGSHASERWMRRRAREATDDSPIQGEVRAQIRRLNVDPLPDTTYPHIVFSAPPPPPPTLPMTDAASTSAGTAPTATS